MKIAILRIGHRPYRDKRITTHCGLVGRAFGADCIIIYGEKDENLINSIVDVTKNWGGNFSARFTDSWKSEIKKWKNEGGTVIHLTMYGMPLPGVMDKIHQLEKIMVIIGSEKVPGEVYRLADYNVAIGNQPHSEVAALAVFLDKLNNEVEFKLYFENAKIRVIPQERGKRVERLN
ncbi:MAG: tRNA (cytidine(56)-2'-O)-methyltransferase [Nitrososphaerota archaeon]|jgi:tRNA (cytidine56-2'-O)-methyltransferase|nr:tRNA (cytidine(56)-2'-O)-methyltransferase [Nitrososphaerota archaeon]MDG6927596.1 tRNA (cytidine(56)-2'-O)-methyltransferase [Nitrososphaerota archaeon]MDG6929919.1 tRNA (cytidine(56)-2'-O)-methyltransferase [Nitrososphaerota archaeon]MDG6931631.1 tRNA (cytidine(56)-2'-O)-methyltransferase [Nitrososphaerota archaeon]MDG6935952.1 tRNA (cytidine(56)-2'-O)-methyltransferase [Nitrososphaerota archaeon]